MELSKYDIIDRFLNGELTPEELAAFDQKIQQDEDLADMLAFQLSLRKSIREEKHEEIRETLDAMLPPTQKGRYLFMPYSAIAAAIAALVLMVYAFNQFWGEKDRPLLSEAEAQQETGRILNRDAAEFQTLGGAAGILRLKEKHADYLAHRHRCDLIDLSYYAGAYSLFVEQNFAAAVQQLRCAEGFRPDVPRLLVIAHCGAGDIEAARALVSAQGISLDSLPRGVVERL